MESFVIRNDNFRRAYRYNAVIALVSLLLGMFAVLTRNLALRGRASTIRAVRVVAV